MRDDHATPQEEAHGTTRGERELEALALRLLVQNFPGEPSLEETRLLVGTLPTDLPEPLPIPSDARIRGSLIRGRQRITILLDTDLSPDATIAFYRDRLGAAGWTLADTHDRGGFSHGEATRNVPFCRSKRGPTLRVDAVSVADVTQIQLELHLDEHYLCRGKRHDIFERIPRLTPPAGEQRAMGGSGSEESAFTSARLTTDLDLPTVAQHYRTQLTEAGWVQVEARQPGPLAQSDYTFTDQDGAPWRGSLLVLHQPRMAGTYLVQVLIEADSVPEAADGGWAEWSRLVSRG